MEKRRKRTFVKTIQKDGLILRALAASLITLATLGAKITLMRKGPWEGQAKRLAVFVVEAP
jgi:hypothetical protein